MSLEGTWHGTARIRGWHGPRTGKLEGPALAGRRKQHGELGLLLAQKALQDLPGCSRMGDGTLQHPAVPPHLDMLGGGFFRVGYRDMNPTPVPDTSPTPLPGGGSWWLLTLLFLPDRMHSSILCWDAGQWICGNNNPGETRTPTWPHQHQLCHRALTLASKRYPECPTTPFHLLPLPCAGSLR